MPTWNQVKLWISLNLASEVVEVRSIHFVSIYISCTHTMIINTTESLLAFPSFYDFKSYIYYRLLYIYIISNFGKTWNADHPFQQNCKPPTSQSCIWDAELSLFLSQAKQPFGLLCLYKALGFRRFGSVHHWVAMTWVELLLMEV